MRLQWVSDTVFLLFVRRGREELARVDRFLVCTPASTAATRPYRRVKGSGRCRATSRSDRDCACVDRPMRSTRSTPSDCVRCTLVATWPNIRRWRSARPINAKVALGVFFHSCDFFAISPLTRSRSPNQAFKERRMYWLSLRPAVFSPGVLVHDDSAYPALASWRGHDD